MRRWMWVIGSFVVLAALVLVGLLASPLSAILAGLVLVAFAGLAVMYSHVVVVRERTALVVCSAIHGAVVRVVRGPEVAFLHPFLERTGPVIDTSFCFEQVYVENILQADRTPTILGFTAHVVHQRAPDTISPAQLGTILPNLIDDLGQIVQHWTSYYLRNLVADLDPVRIHHGSRGRLERHLMQLLSAHLGLLGIHVHGVQLVLWPPDGLHTTLVNAEQERVGIALQGEQLSTILNALVDQSEEARSLALLELARSLGRSGRAWTALDLTSLMGGEPGQEPPGGTQLPFWPGVPFPADRE